MKLNLFLSAMACLLLGACRATVPPAPPLTRMVLWYGAIPRGDTSMPVPTGTMSPEERSVRGVLTSNHATAISIDPYFRRAVFSVPADSPTTIGSLPWVVAMSPWPAVVADGIAMPADAGTDVAADAAPDADGEASSGLMATATGADVVVGIFDIALPAIGVGAFHDLQWVGTADFPDGRRHATHVTGIVGGLGDGLGHFRGRAPAARLRAWSVFGSDGAFNTTLPPATAVRNYIQGSKMHISQNSWTIRPPVNDPCDAFGTYNGFCTEYDSLVRGSGVTVVFSAGNHRCTCYEALCGRGGYRTVMAPATAKNIITVGAVDVDSTMSTFSSYGGSADNRVIPQIVARGVNVVSSVPSSALSTQMEYVPLSGTSMAAPAVSGGLAQMIQIFKAVNGGAVPEPALLKALLLNNATDLGRPGPDMEFGYGIMDIPAAADAIAGARHARGSSIPGGTADHVIAVESGCALKVMLCYSDIAASPGTGAGATLINDLDLELVSPLGTVYHPLKLDPNDPLRPAAPGVIANDNVEQVVVANPVPGEWHIRVIRENGALMTGAQEYAVTWTRACSAVTVPSGGPSGMPSGGPRGE